MKNNVKILRVKHNLTQEQLAEALGVSRQTIIAIESNRYLPSLGLAFKIAHQFSTVVEDIFIPDGEKNDE